MAEPEVIWDVDAELGEGPCWIARDKAVWFVDIKGRRLHRYGVEDRSKRSWPAPDQIGFALPAQDGSLVCGVRGGLYRFDPRTEQFSLIVAVEQDRPQNRLNDGFRRARWLACGSVRWTMGSRGSAARFIAGPAARRCRRTTAMASPMARP